MVMLHFHKMKNCSEKDSMRGKSQDTNWDVQIIYLLSYIYLHIMYLIKDLYPQDIQNTQN